MAQRITLTNVSIVDLYEEEKERFNLSGDFKRLIVSENTKELSQSEFASTYLNPSITPSGSYFIYVDQNQIIEPKKSKGSSNLSGLMYDLTFNSDAEIKKIGYRDLTPFVENFTVAQINDAPSNGIIQICSQNTPYIKKIGMIFK